MKTITLNEAELDHCKELVADLKSRYGYASHPEFLTKSRLYSTELPRTLRSAFRGLKYCIDDQGMVTVRGFPVESDLRPTPDNWDYPESYKPFLGMDFFTVLLSSLLGEPIGWETQQKAKIIHDLIPIEGREDAQTGYGSHSELALHTEDAFHHHRGDYVSFYCLRNPQNVPTTFASIRDLNLPSDVKSRLFEKRFYIVPDESHLDAAQVAKHANGDYMHRFSTATPPTSILFGNFDAPYLCYDPYYTLLGRLDAASKEAFDYLTDQITQNIMHFALQPGDICLVDNHKVVHGRASFVPAYDGTDRWLKRINIASDLRSSAEFRATIQSRIIGDSHNNIEEYL